MNSNRRSPLPLLAFALLCATFQTRAEIPSPEKLLPDNTAVMVTTPDFGKLREIFKASPQYQLWNDPAMKPFREKFFSKWNEEFRKPLERELEINSDDYISLPQGQVTFALIPNGLSESQDDPMSMLLLIDTRDQTNQLKANLANLRKKWRDAGKPIRTETIRGFEFTVVSVTTNDIPVTFQKFFPPAPLVQELGAEPESKKTIRKELVIGQAESLLIIGNSSSVIEKVVARMTGSSVPVLGEMASYDSNHQALFRKAPVYGWMNVKSFFQTKTLSESEKNEPEAPDPMGNPTVEKLIAATGLTSLKTIAFNLETSSEGSLFKIFFSAPEPRRGFFNLFSSDSKDTRPPSFVPADVVEFQRWRIDLQKAWNILGKLLGDIYPQWKGGLDLLLEAASNSAKEKDPGFDLKKYLVGNLGDDVIRYEKPARPGTRGQTGSPEGIFLLGSPNPNQLAAALKNFLVFLNQGAVPTEREFLGRKIFSLPMPNLGLPGTGGDKPGPPRTLSCAASGGYVAISTDVAMLEEYMRSSESQARTLGETPGLMEAAQKVLGPGTVLFGYQNQVESARTEFELLKKEGASITNMMTMLPGVFGLPSPQNAIKQLTDYSLLPPFDGLAKYFHFTVYGVGASVDGVTFKWFAPIPPKLP